MINELEAQRWRYYRDKGTRAGFEGAIRTELPAAGISVRDVELFEDPDGPVVYVRVLLPWWWWPWALIPAVRDHIVDVTNLALEAVRPCCVIVCVKSGWLRGRNPRLSWEGQV